jgi:hypothetical protein
MEFYKAKGFMPVEVPVGGHQRAVDITCPNPSSPPASMAWAPWWARPSSRSSI